MVKSYLLVCLLVTGCATCTPEVRVVKGPIPPVIVVPDRPQVPPSTSQSDKLKAVAEYVVELRTRLEQALSALDAYR